ncbi:hypothetical protein [Aquibacillus salsiterrae]|uniref:Uncharacterized protein n=1 Tax=Aquibacillus salsiterrae TaxID=2950439 RepID=A0A9X4AFK2_9BACI|nr:hypothetical protein [Aquibacillus salsiterrae]MDC3416108.1 hypothetical protein [Aquibacillus salsiterrae]
MNKYLSFCFTLVILTIIAGCTNNEEKVVSFAKTNIETSLADKQPISIERQTQHLQQQKPTDKISAGQSDTTTGSNSTVASVQTKDNVEEKTAGEDSQEETQAPPYRATIKSGLIAQQRLVEVKLDVEQPENYQVLVRDEPLKYRKEVGLFVGLINAMDDEAITNSIHITRD